jgi:putative FmdB family regulatory protein
MPLYEYACRECEHSFEMLVFPGETVECPECKSRQVERQLSVPARPQRAPTALPMGCRSAGPPCGPMCSRWSEGG